jgi:lysine-specific demethylase 3
MHMDIADAINVMTYASKRDDGKQGCAVWHIYRKDDLDKIRAFLREKFAAVHQFVDPVHSQLFYLDSTLRQELFDKTGVFAHRIYQYPVRVKQESLPFAN